MKKILKQSMLFSMAVLIMMTSLVGCGSKISNSDVVAVFDDKDVSLSLANFYARYLQSSYESYLTMYGGEVQDTWKSEVEGGKTYEQMTKDTIMDQLQELYVLDAEKENYDIALTDEEETSIKAAAKKFMDENDKEAIEVMSASEDVIVELLSLMTISNKVKDKIKEDVDTEVSDEEAAQKAMKYVQFAHTDTEKEATEDDIAKLKSDAEDLAEAVKGGQDIAAAAEEAGYTATDLTFDAETTTPNEDLIKAADKLAVGEVTQVIEGDNVYFVAYLESEFDEDATESKKTSIIEERKTELYDEKYAELKKDHDWSVNKKVWKKVEFVKTAVTQKEAAEEGGDDNTTEPDSDSSNDADGTDDSTDDGTSGDEGDGTEDDNDGSDETDKGNEE